jgi:hypothetical protein
VNLVVKGGILTGIRGKQGSSLTDIGLFKSASVSQDAQLYLSPSFFLQRREYMEWNGRDVLQMENLKMGTRILR